MNISLILIIVGLVIVFFLAFKLLKKVIKAAITVFVIALLLLVVVGVIIYNDSMTLRKGFQEQNLMVFTYEDRVVTAFRAEFDLSVTAVMTQSFYESLPREELEEVVGRAPDESLKDFEYENLLLVMDQEMFYDKVITLNGVDINFSRQVLEDFAVASDAEEAVLILGGVDGFDVSVVENFELFEIKNYIYYELFKSRFKDTRGGFLIDGIRQSYVDTTPRLLSISVLNFFPKSIMDRLSGEN